MNTRIEVKVTEEMTLQDIKFEFLIQQLIGSKKMNLNFYDTQIKEYEEEIRQLEKEKMMSPDFRRLKEINSQLKMKNRALKLRITERNIAENQILKIRSLIDQYIELSTKLSVDGSLSNSQGLDPNFTTVSGERNLTANNPTADDQIKAALIALGQKDSIINAPEYKVKKQMDKIAKKILEELKKSKGLVEYDIQFYTNDSNGKQSVRCEGLEELLSCERNKLLDSIIYMGSDLKTSNIAPQQIRLKSGLIVNPKQLAWGSKEYDEYCASFIKEINEIDNILKAGNLTTKQQNQLIEVQNMYKKYATHLIAYQTIEYFLPSLVNHSSSIKQLEQIVLKEELVCLKLKENADKTLSSLKQKHNIDVVYEEEVQDNEEIIEEEEISPVVEEKKEEEIEQPKLDLEDLKRKSSAYRSRYVEERIKGTDLGKLDFSEYVKRVAPQQTELYDYLKLQEEEAVTIYKEYIRDRAQRIAKNQPVIGFKRFVEIQTRKDYYESDIELPYRYEEELKELEGGKTL